MRTIHYLHIANNVNKKDENEGKDIKEIEIQTEKVINVEDNKPAAQAAGQTLPNAPPPVGKIHPFRKITVTYSNLDALQDSESQKKFQYSLFYD